MSNPAAAPTTRRRRLLLPIALLTAGLACSAGTGGNAGAGAQGPAGGGEGGGAGPSSPPPPDCAPRACADALSAGACGVTSDGCGGILTCPTDACGAGKRCGCAGGAHASTCVEATTCDTTPPGSYPRTPERAGAVPAAEAVEMSGIVSSRVHPGVLWGHEDSGSGCRFYSYRYALDGSPVQLLESFVFGGGGDRCIDIEDVSIAAVSGGWMLYLADSGDNFAQERGPRCSWNPNGFRVFRLAEPAPESSPSRDPATVKASPLTTGSYEKLTLKYPDDPFNCEAMFVDPATGDLYFVTKNGTDDGQDGDDQECGVPTKDAGRVYRARKSALTPGQTITLEYVSTIGRTWITAADMSVDGLRLAVRNYGQIFIYTRGDTTTSVADMLASGPTLTLQSSRDLIGSFEAIAFAFDRDRIPDYDLLTIGESGNGQGGGEPAEQPLYLYRWQ